MTNRVAGLQVAFLTRFMYDSGMGIRPIANAKRVVIKLGSAVLTDRDQQLDENNLRHLVGQIARVRSSGVGVIIVTSGAVAAGMRILGHTVRPKRLTELQASAAVGQALLMAKYDTFFQNAGGYSVAQVLLTHEDLEDRERHLNVRRTLERLLGMRSIIPIVNENDSVAVAELRFGDNDKLAALVAAFVSADLLILLTSVDGVMQHYGDPKESSIGLIWQIDESVESLARSTNSAVAVGGMASKIQAAKIARRSGIPAVVASGRKQNVITDILEGRQEGTLFIPHTESLRQRKRWIAFFRQPKGVLWVDAGAKVALCNGGRSLLMPGVIRCEGAFASGEVVKVCDNAGSEFARGICRLSADDIRSGRSSNMEIIQRHDLVIL